MTYSRTSTARTATTGSSLPSVTAEQDARTGSTASPATCSGTPTRPIRAKTTSATSSLHLHFKFSSVSLQNVEVKITRKKFHGNLLLYFLLQPQQQKISAIFFVATKVNAMGNSLKKMSTIWTKIKVNWRIVGATLTRQKRNRTRKYFFYLNFQPSLPFVWQKIKLASNNLGEYLLSGDLRSQSFILAGISDQNFLPQPMVLP